MDINRDNYEEYFLLYADNELTDSEKAQVLMFVKDNKDLEEEFRMIHYTIARPDLSIGFTNKSFLLKNDPSSFINEKNYEEVFVLYHDKELTEDQKNETEEFLYAHPQLKNDFDLIGLARLTPENEILFPVKKILYKKEKPGKVISIVFWRVAAAAVLLGFGLWIAYSYLKTPEKIVATNTKSINQRSSDSTAIDNTLSKKEITNAVTQHSEPSSKDKSDKSAKLPQQKKSTNNALAKNVSKSVNINEKNIVNQIPDKITNEIAVEDQDIKNLAKEEVSVINKIQPSPTEFAAANESQKDQQIIKKANENDDEKAQPVTYAQTASYIQNADNKNENYVFYDVTADEFRKTKIGGFLKKVKRVIERNNPITRLLSDENQVASN
jgi:cytoskeletal protein RodZ